MLEYAMAFHHNPLPSVVYSPYPGSNGATIDDLMASHLSVLVEPKLIFGDRANMDVEEDEGFGLLEAESLGGRQIDDYDALELSVVVDGTKAWGQFVISCECVHKKFVLDERGVASTVRQGAASDACVHCPFVLDLNATILFKGLAKVTLDNICRDFEDCAEVGSDAQLEGREAISSV